MISEIQGQAVSFRAVGVKQAQQARAYMQQGADRLVLSTEKQPLLQRISNGFENLLARFVGRSEKIVDENARLLNTPFGQHLKGLEYEFDYGPHGDFTGTARLYTDENICKIVAAQQDSLEKVVKLMDLLREDTHFTCNQAMDLAKDDPEGYDILVENGKVDVDRIAQIKALKHIERQDVHDGCNMKTIQALDNLMEKDADIVEQFIKDRDVNYYIIGTENTEEELAQFLEAYKELPYLCKLVAPRMYRWNADEPTPLNKTLEYVNLYRNDSKLTQKYLETPIGDLNSVEKIKGLIRLHSEGVDVERYLQESPYMTVADIDFREKTKALFASKDDNTSYRELGSIYAKIEDKTLIDKMIKDGHKPKSANDFKLLVELYNKYPDKAISPDFVNYYKQHQRDSEYIDLMQAFERTKKSV